MKKLKNEELNMEESEQSQKQKEEYGRKLNFSAILSILQQQKKGTMMQSEQLKKELKSYGFEIKPSSIIRSIGGSCFVLLTIHQENSEKSINELFPFFIHAVIDFGKGKNNLEECFYQAFRKCVKATKNKKVEELTEEEKRKIREKVNENFPLTLSPDGKQIEKMDLHFPLHYQENGEDAYITSQISSDVDMAPEYTEFLKKFYREKENVYYFPNNTQYYIEEERLSELELKMIMDSIEVFSYISKEDTITIMQKLERLNSPVLHHSYEGEKYPDKVERLNPSDSKMLFDNLEVIEKCIENRQKMWVQYGEYQYIQTANGDGVIKLQPRQNYRTLDENGKSKWGQKLVSPYHIMWANGFYYAIVMYEGKSNLAALRIDRILFAEKAEDEKGNRMESEPLPEEYYAARIEGTDKLSSQKIMNMAVVMHTERPEKVIFRCKKYLLNNVIDGFGFDIKVTRPAEENGDEWLEVTSEQASISGASLWLTQHCADSYAVEPPKLVEKVAQNLKRGSVYY